MRKLKHSYTRCAALLTAAALMAAALPLAFAQSTPETGAPADVFAVPEEPVLTTVGEYCEGRIRVTDGTLWGYAGVDGGVVIQPQFEQVENFHLGAARVTRNGKVGLLRWDGTFILAPQYDVLTAVDYGVYLGRRGSVWDVLSITALNTAGGTTHQLYADLASAEFYTGTAARLALRDQSGTATTIMVSALPQLLESRKVPGWQFPLSHSRKAVFQDVAENDWFSRWVDLAYSVGMMEGTGGGKFEPLRSLTVAEALRLAACMESRVRQDDFHVQPVSSPAWYTSSVVYCEASGIIGSGEFSQKDYDRPITRAEMARIFAGATPVRSIRNINDLNHIRTSIPDVAAGDPGAEAVYGLYAKGILNGVDGTHAFHPDSPLTRAEAAAIVARIARPEQRIAFW